MKTKFSDIRKYIAIYDPVSICIYETGDFENYFEMRSAPEKYDNMFFYEIGKFESSFINNKGEEVWCQCTEIVLSYNPRFKEEIN